VSTDREIRSVADTALWMASIRALEATRHDAIIHDRLASLLAGDRGRCIERSMPRSAMVAWGVIVRASAIDRLLADVLRQGVDVVINLGAGMDTRPYRMDLPSSIRWIEIDFPEIVECKNSRLRACRPGCPVERVGLDLLDREARRTLFARYGAESKSAVLIAEGVIPYLSNGEVAGLAEDIFSVPSFGHWLLDFDNAGKRPPPRSWSERLKAAPFLFQVNDWFEFFDGLGWKPQKTITSAEESSRINRPFPFAFPLGLLMHVLPKEVSRKILSVSGAVLMAKQ
jgi:methyltransferase (TIGR00027 family)